MNDACTLRAAELAALGLLLASGCGVAVSLDVPAAGTTEASSSSSAGDSRATSSVGADSESSAESTESTSDSPDLPPSDACAPGCEVKLPLVWRWQGEGPTPIKDHRITAITSYDFDGSIFVAESRGGEAWISHIDGEGETLWSQRIQLFCDCEIVDLEPLFTGEIGFSAKGTLDGLFPLLSVGRFTPFEGEAPWVNYIGLPEAEDRLPRVGSLLSFLDDLVGVVVIMPENSGALPNAEVVTVYRFDYFGNVVDVHRVDSQTATDPNVHPVGSTLVDNTAVVAYPSFAGDYDRGYVVWTDLGLFGAMTAEALPGIPDDLLVASEGRVLVASHLQIAPTELELYLTQVRRGQPVEWEVSTTFHSSAAATASSMTNVRIALDFMGRPHVAMLNTQSTGDAGEADVQLELMQFEVDGSERWRSTLAMSPYTLPELPGFGVTEDGGLVIATSLEGRVLVDKREPSCACE